MRYYLDCEFIEDFHKPLFNKKRHFIDLISIAIVSEDGREYHAISSEYNYDDASDWVKENVIIPLYTNTISGDARNSIDANYFNKISGKSNETIKQEILEFTKCWREPLFYRAPEGIEFYGYFADYDWVLLCSLFGRMIDLPKGFPMYCRDLKQMMDERLEKLHFDFYGEDASLESKINITKTRADYPKNEKGHLALHDARFNKKLHDFILTKL